MADLPLDSSEMSSGVLAAGQAMVAVQLVVCAGALCAFPEHSPPQPLSLAASVPRHNTLELGLFPMLMSLGVPRGKEWSLGGLHQGHLWCLLCSHQTMVSGGCPDSICLPAMPRCGQGDVVCEMKSLLS